MRKLIAVAALILGPALLPCSVKAQTCQYSCELGATATFTWNGTTDTGNTVQFVTIDDQVPNQAIGFSGSIRIMSGNYLNYLGLPEPGTCSEPFNPDGTCPGETFPGFPNNGTLVYLPTVISWGDKQWGTRTDNTPMDGTEPGDTYSQTGTTQCVQGNGTTDVSLTKLVQYNLVRKCLRGGGHICYQYGLVLTSAMTGGYGTATVVQ